MERAPHPALSGMVRSVWLSTPAAQSAPGPSHELMMPTGEMHLVLRLAGPSIAAFERPGDPAPQNFGHAVVNGARAGAYTKLAARSSSIGLQLRPGASLALLGLPADELAGRHVRLEDIWGSDAGMLREQLLAAPSADAKLHRLETFLMARLQRSPAPGANPAVLAGLQQLDAGSSVDGAARHSGYSQRQFARLMMQAAGLTPRLYQRLQRFRRALRLMHGPVLQDGGLAAVAFAAGFSDQPHFNRDFREFAGLTPAQYLCARPHAISHVPVSWTAGHGVRFVQYGHRQSA